MTNDEKRLKVANAYPSDKWTHKVSKMTDAQVHALYMNLLGKRI